MSRETVSPIAQRNGDPGDVAENLVEIVDCTRKENSMDQVFHESSLFYLIIKT